MRYHVSLISSVLISHTIVQQTCVWGFTYFSSCLYLRSSRWWKHIFQKKNSISFSSLSFLAYQKSCVNVYIIIVTKYMNKYSCQLRDKKKKKKKQNPYWFLFQLTGWQVMSTSPCGPTKKKKSCRHERRAIIQFYFKHNN